MKKRTIATVRQLTLEVNTILPDAPTMSFHKKGMDRYILSFAGPIKDREFGPMSCGEACEFISGIIYSRMETAKLLNKQALYIDQLEDTVDSSKSNGELKVAERLIQTQRLTIDNLSANVTALIQERNALVEEHHKNAVAQAKSVREMHQAMMLMHAQKG